ncbi:MAG: signal peptide peptidase SppA [Cyanobacteriota bacterium]
MKKDILALAIIIICCLGALIGLIGSFREPSSIVDNSTVKASEKNLLSKLTGGDKIAVIRLTGVISDSTEDSDFFVSTSPAIKARKYLDKAAKDKSVKAVVFRINSPGGTVAASQEVYEAMLRCRERKPVVVSMGDVAASGGYYISSAADVIVANPGTLTGSIGVILNAVSFIDLMDKIGVKSNVIKSGKFKDIGSSMRPMTKEDKELLKGIIDNTYEQFVGDIIKGRIDRKDIADTKKIKKVKKSTTSKKDFKDDEEEINETQLTPEILRENADGRIFTGQQALKIGLVDELGDLDKAKIIALKLAKKRFKNVKDTIDFEIYDKPQTFAEILLEIKSSVIPKSSMDQAIPFSVKYPNQPLWIME